MTSAAATPGVDELVDRLAEQITDAQVDPARALLALAWALDRRTSTVHPPVGPRFAALEALASDHDGGSRGIPEPLAALVEQVADAPGAGPQHLGRMHELVIDPDHRHRRGAFYTPPRVAAGLVRASLRLVDRDDADPSRFVPTICDPSAGGGVFLLAVADALRLRGLDVSAIVERCLWGSDIDPLAAAVASAALVLWGRAYGSPAVDPNVVCADPLALGREVWPGAPVEGFTVVIGNPPFQNQLGSGTARTPERAAALRARWGPSVFRYTDTAALFLLAGVELAAEAGVVAMIVPVPVLVTDDAEAVRRELLDRATPVHLWLGGDDVFAAGVRVCAPVLRVATRVEPGDGLRSFDASSIVVTRSSAEAFTALAPRRVDRSALRAAGTWGDLVADTFGIPTTAPVAADRPRLGGFCMATAGFRDQYYGLKPFVVEAVDAAGATDPSGAADADRWPLLVTSGLVDPARLLWGRRPTRFDGRRWDAPVVDRRRLERDDPALAAWAAARLVPKVVVATQTRVLEAAVDVDGTWFPSVPTIALSCAPERLWEAAAVVLAPSTSAWAMGRHVGAALSADALKVSARQLLDAPLPVDRSAWLDGADLLREATAATDGETWRDALDRFGAAMALAYAAPDEVLAWWRDRLPRWR